jgi:hypothetical protein
MKRNRILFIAALVTMSFLSSCDKDTEGVSKVTTYPAFTLAGGPFVNLLVDPTKPFVDPGVTAKIGTKDYPIETKGTVDLSKPGLYQLYYSSKSDEGYPTSTDRKVLVTSQPITDNYEGSYDLVSTAGVVKKSSAVKLMTQYLGWYSVTNMWWQENAVPGEIVDFGGGTLSVSGDSNYGPYKGTGVRQPDGRILFSCTITSGGNAGAAWKVYFAKK